MENSLSFHLCVILPLVNANVSSYGPESSRHPPPLNRTSFSMCRMTNLVRDSEAICYSSSSSELPFSAPTVGFGSASFRLLKAFIRFLATIVVIQVPLSSARRYVALSLTLISTYYPNHSFANLRVDRCWLLRLLS